MTTGVPSGRRASALSVRSVAWRQPALAGVPIVCLEPGGPCTASRSPPFHPAGSRGWFPEMTTMQQPRPQRVPATWSVTWNLPLGVGESLHNVAAAFALVTIGAIAASIGAYRIARAPKAAGLAA